MKKIFLLILFIVAALTSFSQIHVKENSFHIIDGFLMMDKSEHIDDNNVPMALIKISTENISAEERRKITFKGNLATYFDVQFKTSEIYLYLSTTATFLEIHHPDYGKTEYWLPEDLCDYCGYEMVVVSGYNTDKVIEEKVVYVNESPDGVNRNKRQDYFKIALSLNYACNNYQTSSYGFSVATINKNKSLAVYLDFMSNLNFFEDSGLECDKDGFIDGNSCYYTGRIEKTRMSIILGTAYKLSELWYMKFGVGVGTHEIYWEDTEKRMVLNKENSLKGFDMSMGFMYIYNRINISIDFVTTNVKTVELKIGLGFNF